MEILVQSCCGICSLSYLELIKEHQATLFFYNPNLHPSEEYLKRRETVKKVAREFNFRFLEGKYNAEDWLKAVKSLESEPENGKRCLVCFEFRLRETAKMAKEQGFGAFSTTLNLSPYKDIDFINQKGRELAQEFRIKYLEFGGDRNKRFELSRKAQQLAKPLTLYPQKYCGCVYSINKK